MIQSQKRRGYAFSDFVTKVPSLFDYSTVFVITVVISYVNIIQILNKLIKVISTSKCRYAILLLTIITTTQRETILL